MNLRSWQGYTLAAVVAGAVTLAGVAAYATREPERFTLRGSITLYNHTGRDRAPLPICGGLQGFADINEGAQVTVRDAGGAVLALGRLERGEWQTDTGECRFEIKVPGVPDGEDFYQVEVAHRGSITVNNQEAKTTGPAFTLG